MDEVKLKTTCSAIARAVQKYMADEEHRKEFERWYEERYKRKYEWRKQ